MKEYEDLSYITQMEKEKNRDIYFYYLPHHGVLNENRITTKLRVVYNSSQETTSGISFNDIVLARLKCHPNKLKTFIHNRVAEIQEFSCAEEDEW